MKFKSIVALFLVFLMCSLFAVGCAKKGETDNNQLTTTDDYDVMFSDLEKFTKPDYKYDFNELYTTTETNSLIPVEKDRITKNENLVSSDYILNVLLLGVDDNKVSDTIMLLSIDTLHNKIKLTSFLRDTYVEIPGYYSHKLSMAYAIGEMYDKSGAELCIKTLEEHYGVLIDRYAIVEFYNFKDIIDILGGVELYLTDEEIGYINAQVASNGQSDYLYASEGVVTLTGAQALWHARNRGGVIGGVTYSGSDWERVDRQKDLIEAIINGVKTASSLELVRIADSVVPNATTDLTADEIKALVSNGTIYLNYDIEKCSMPTDGVWSYGWDDAVGSIIKVDDWNSAKQELAEFIYEDEVE